MPRKSGFITDNLRLIATINNQLEFLCEIIYFPCFNCAFLWKNIYGCD